MWSGVVKPSVIRSEVSSITDPNRIQFSVATLLGAITLTSIVLVAVYNWHRWVLWSTEPFVDPSEQWFIDSRQHMFNWSTPVLAGFILVASFAVWYAITRRDRIESWAGGLSLAFPILLPLGPFALLSFFIPFATPLVGCWLIYRRRLLLGGFVIVFAVSWLFFSYHYIDDWFAVYGD